MCAGGKEAATVSTKDQIKALQAALTPWAEGEGGYVKIARDKSQLVDLLGMKPGAVRVVLLWMGEVTRGEVNTEDMSRVDRTFWAVVSRGQGFKVEPSDSLTEGSGGGRAMYELADECRDLLRSVELDPETTEHPIYYKGTLPLPFEDLPRTDAMYVEISIGTDIGMLSNVAAN
jgi:hypothetical protein